MENRRLGWNVSKLELGFALQSFKDKTVLLTRDWLYYTLGSCYFWGRKVRLKSFVQLSRRILSTPFVKPVSVTWFLGHMQHLAIWPLPPLAMFLVLFLFPISNVSDLAAYKRDMCEYVYVCVFKSLHLFAWTQTPICVPEVMKKREKKKLDWGFWKFYPIGKRKSRNPYQLSYLVIKVVRHEIGTDGIKIARLISFSWILLRVSWKSL